MMPQLWYLPSELLLWWLAIASRVPQPALRGLAHAIDVPTELVTSLPYKSVFFGQPDFGGFHGGQFPIVRPVPHQVDQDYTI